MTRHVVVFARAPQAGRVKRRLAREIGTLAALRFVRATLFRQLRQLAHDKSWTLWLFITPDSARGHAAWRQILPARVRGQGPGDLGQRMSRPFRQLPPGPLVLVGSDIPAMSRTHLLRVFALLGRHDLVFGPASDGGYWLIGARRSRPLPYGLFRNVRWSTEHALADTRANIPRHFSVALADTLDDVDKAADLARSKRR